MLETVVKQEHFAFKAIYGELPRGIAMPADNDGNAWEKACHHVRFIAAFRGGAEPFFAICHDGDFLSGLAFIAAEEDGDTRAICLELFRNGDDCRRFPRAANDDIADADDSAWQTARLKNTARVACIPQRDDGGVDML